MNCNFGKFIVLLLEDFQKKEKAIQSEIKYNENELFQNVKNNLRFQLINK